MKFTDEFINEDDSEYFWSWIGHSKVLDEHGYPLVVFHGTKNMQFGVAETENHRLRMMFSDDPDKVSARHLHEDYVEHAAKLEIERVHPWGVYKEYDIYPSGAMIIPAILHMVNPLRLDDDIAFFTKKIGGIKPEYVGILLAAGYTEREIKTFTYNEHIEVVAGMLLEKGYDGVSFPNIAEGAGETSWIVVDPIQIYPVFGDRPKLSDIIGRL